jgi:CRP/FNR family cyclic AMP-dependent transcriptional regulator
MNVSAYPAFDLTAFLANSGAGRKLVQLKPKQPFFSQGDPSDSVWYLQRGRAKITVVSATGREATVTLLVPHDFIGEEALSANSVLRLYTASAITACLALKISRDEMTRVIHVEQTFSDLFLKCLLARSMRTQADLVDQLFNSSGKNPSVNGGIWRVGSAGALTTPNFSTDSCGYDRDHPFARELLHESIPQAWLD